MLSLEQLRVWILVAASWNGEADTRKALMQTVNSAIRDKDWETAYKLLKVMVGRPGLTALFRARLHHTLAMTGSLAPNRREMGCDAGAHLRDAAAAVDRASTAIGESELVERWRQKIIAAQAELHTVYYDVSDRESEGEEEENVPITTTEKQRKDAEAFIEKRIHEQKLRQRVNRLPAAKRLAAANKSFRKGKGTAGTVKEIQKMHVADIFKPDKEEEQLEPDGSGATSSQKSQAGENTTGNKEEKEAAGGEHASQKDSDTTAVASKSGSNGVVSEVGTEETSLEDASFESTPFGEGASVDDGYSVSDKMDDNADASPGDGDTKSLSFWENYNHWTAVSGICEDREEYENLYAQAQKTIRDIEMAKSAESEEATAAREERWEDEAALRTE